MYEQTDGTYDNPFKFNAKELDDDTGLYYYGARYYNPRLSIWYGINPLANKFPNWSSYSYTFDNPVRYTDPDGMAQRIQVLKIDTINHLMSKKTFDNFIAYGKIKVDGNFLNKVIDDKN